MNSKKVMTRIFRMFIGFLLLVVLIGVLTGKYSWSTFLALVFGTVLLIFILSYNAPAKDRFQEKDRD